MTTLFTGAVQELAVGLGAWLRAAVHDHPLLSLIALYALFAILARRLDRWQEDRELRAWWRTIHRELDKTAEALERLDQGQPAGSSRQHVVRRRESIQVSIGREQTHIEAPNDGAAAEGLLASLLVVPPLAPRDDDEDDDEGEAWKHAR